MGGHVAGVRGPVQPRGGAWGGWECARGSPGREARCRAAMLRNVTTGETPASRVVRCDTFWKRGRGLMFRSMPARDQGYLFIEGRESVAQTAIHMFFVFFAIAVIWLDRDKRVVDKVLARRGAPYAAGLALAGLLLLVLAAPAAAQGPTAEPEVYVVQPGDTLFSI